MPIDYGPAGMFSTDNAQADQNQTDCEQYDPFEDDPEEEQASKPKESMNVFAWCTEEAWWSSWDVSTEEEYEEFKKLARQEHLDQCGCGNPENFRIDPFKK